MKRKQYDLKLRNTSKNLLIFILFIYILKILI